MIVRFDDLTTGILAQESVETLVNWGFSLLMGNNGLWISTVSGITKKGVWSSVVARFGRIFFVEPLAESAL